MRAPKYLISACLAGERCRYDGRTAPSSPLETLVHSGLAVTICPEVAGGLPIPRTPCERQNELVIDCDGHDRTAIYTAGAQQALALAQQYQITTAILKERSPSCGSTQIYDGTFSHKRINGIGITTQLLRQHGLTVYSEENYPPEILSEVE